MTIQAESPGAVNYKLYSARLHHGDFMWRLKAPVFLITLRQVALHEHSKHNQRAAKPPVSRLAQHAARHPSEPINLLRGSS